MKGLLTERPLKVMSIYWLLQVGGLCTASIFSQRSWPLQARTVGSIFFVLLTSEGASHYTNKHSYTHSLIKRSFIFQQKNVCWRAELGYNEEGLERLFFQVRGRRRLHIETGSHDRKVQRLWLCVVQRSWRCWQGISFFFFAVPKLLAPLHLILFTTSLRQYNSW